MGCSVVAFACLTGGARAQEPPTPEGRALAYLEREVPRWSAENQCYSCHHDGDGARALHTALRQGDRVDPKALPETDRWLGRPEGWDRNGGDGPGSDKRLARLQFTLALEAAVASGRINGRAALDGAARRLAADQGEDGSWTFDGADALGAPTTYGRPLATALARGALARIDRAAFARPIARADAWLARRPIANTPDAAAVALAFAREPAGRRADARRWLLKAQGPDGGWGAFADAPAEPFDTALALLALGPEAGEPDALPALRRGRAALVAMQEPDGHWPETTRPPGGVSAAQRLSTTAWAALALLATRDLPADGHRPPP